MTRTQVLGVGFRVASLLSCVLICVLAFELAAAVLLPSHVEALRRRAFGDDRVLFVTKAAYVDRDGYYKFRPGIEYREVAYYPDGDGKATKEYECSYRSDELGFLSNSVGYREASILLLGDSFTQGQGGCEWLPRLSSETRGKLYSAAVQGHGFMHWEKIVADLGKLRKPTKVLVIFITDDFYRPLSLVGDGQRGCLEGTVACTDHYWFPIAAGMDETAQARLAERLRGPSLLANPKAFIKGALPASFGLLRIVLGYARNSTDNFAGSLQVLERFAQDFDLRLVWVSDRHDAEGSARESAVARALAERRLVAARCQLPADGYLPRDGHPNATGYDTLRDCVEEVVAGWR